MTSKEAYEIAEQQLYGHLPRLGEFGWRLYTDKERKRLMLLANSLYSAATKKTFWTREEGHA